jgi:DNA-binding response OmpR family regulator
VTEIIINKENKMVCANNKEIKLTKKELEILMLLINNIGNACSRDMIYRRIFNRSFDIINDRALDAHIVNIRRKMTVLLGLGNSFIQAIRNIGYIIDPDSFIFTLS